MHGWCLRAPRWCDPETPGVQRARTAAIASPFVHAHGAMRWQQQAHTKARTGQLRADSPLQFFAMPIRATEHTITVIGRLRSLYTSGQGSQAASTSTRIARTRLRVARHTK